MQHPTCGATKADATICGKRCTAGGRWCGVHQKQFDRVGEAGMVANVARAIHNRERRYRRHHAVIWREVDTAMRAATGYTLPRDLMRNIRALDTLPPPFFVYFTQMFTRLNRIVDTVYNNQPGWWQATLELIADITQHAPRRQQARPGELAQFAQDRQNVHTTVMVKQTKDIIDRVLKIAVPEEYRYTNGHKTLAEVLLDVAMSDKAADWFVDKYLKHESIYEYPAGIYAKVCDSVWQYVRASPDKADLCRIMRTELEDNIGMCAQGNLTRLCNVLAGYMEGINTESPGEVLQRRMAKLMEVDDDAERLTQGKKILEELAVPHAEWAPWLEALA